MPPKPKLTNPNNSGSIKPGPSHPASDGIKNTDLFAVGLAKFLTGAAILGAAFLGFITTLDVPFADWILGFAKNAVMVALRAVIAGMTSGLDDIEHSLDNPSPQLKVLIDIVKVGLDFTGVLVNFVMTVTSLQGAAQELGQAGSFMRAVKDMATEGTQGGKYINNLNLARANIVNGIFGGIGLWGDWNQLSYDVQAADATPS